MPEDLRDVLRAPTGARRDGVMHIVIPSPDREAPRRVSTPIWVWGLLKRGARSAEELASDLGCSRQVIYNAICSLRRRGQIIERRHGRYDLVEDRPLPVRGGWPGLKLGQVLVEPPEPQARPPRGEAPQLATLKRYRERGRQSRDRRRPLD